MIHSFDICRLIKTDIYNRANSNVMFLVHNILFSYVRRDICVGIFIQVWVLVRDVVWERYEN